MAPLQSVACGSLGRCVLLWWLAVVVSTLDGQPEAESHTGRSRRQSTPVALRIVFRDIDTANATVLSDAQRSRLNAVLNATRDWARGALAVRKPGPVPLHLNRACGANLGYRRASPPRPGGVEGPYQYFCLGQCRNVTQCGPAIPSIPATDLDQCHQCYTAPLNIQRCDANVTDPETPGIANADVAVYVVRDCSFVPAGQLASGDSCTRYATTDRPNGGWLAICPRRLGTDVNSISYEVSEIQREVVRILGVSRTQMGFWKDSASGAPQTTRDSTDNLPKGGGPYGVGTATLSEETQVGGGGGEVKRYQLRSPAVRAEARRHFGCPTLAGMPMEDYGNNSDVFEMRTVGPSELLTLRTFLPSSRLVPVVSRLTLAALEDTGWYSVDYSKAFALNHGVGRGCDFVVRGCDGYINTSVANLSLISQPTVSVDALAAFAVSRARWSSPRQPEPTPEDMLPYCNIVRSTAVQLARCSATRQTITACNLDRLNTAAPIPYFTDARVFAPDPVADSCPSFSSVLVNSSHDVTATPTPGVLPGFAARCDDIGSAPAVNWALEQYSASSLCVEHAHPWQRLPYGESVYQIHTEATGAPYYGAGCYRRECLDNGSMILSVAGVSILCRRAGVQVNFTLTANSIPYVGGIVCPSPSEFCAARHCPSNCSWHGDCRQATGSSSSPSYECVCYPGYATSSCGQHADGTPVDVQTASSSNPDIGPPPSRYFTAWVIANIAAAAAVVVCGTCGFYITQCWLPSYRMRKLRREARRRQNQQAQQAQSAGLIELQRSNMRANDSTEVIGSTHGASYPRQAGWRAPSSSISVKTDETVETLNVSQSRSLAEQESLGSEEHVIQIVEEGYAPTATSHPNTVAVPNGHVWGDGGGPTGLLVGPISHTVSALPPQEDRV